MFEIWEIFKNNYFEEYLQVAGSDNVDPQSTVKSMLSKYSWDNIAQEMQQLMQCWPNSHKAATGDVL